jgi:hypothetical protein
MTFPTHICVCPRNMCGLIIFFVGHLPYVHGDIVSRIKCTHFISTGCPENGNLFPEHPFSIVIFTRFIAYNICCKHRLLLAHRSQHAYTWRVTLAALLGRQSVFSLSRLFSHRVYRHLCLYKRAPTFTLYVPNNACTLFLIARAL